MAHDPLDKFRGEIDRIDAELISLLAERFASVREIAAVKGRAGIPVTQPRRVADVLSSRAQWARDAGVDDGCIRELFSLLIEQCSALEEREIEASDGQP